MALFEMHCQYCGKKWEINIYFTPKEKNIRCIVCNDPNLKYKSVDEIRKKADVFGYNLKNEDDE